MIKRSFFAFKKPRFEYQPLEKRVPEPLRIPASQNVTLFLPATAEQKGLAQVHQGDLVRTGQKIRLGETDSAYVTSSVSGTVRGISSHTGDFGTYYTAISIDVTAGEEIDEAFASASATPTLDLARQFLAVLPGKPPIELFGDPDNPIHTIVVTGLDSDLLVQTNRYILQNRADDIKQGLEILKEISGIENIIVAAPKELAADASATGGEFKLVAGAYPAAVPNWIMKDVLGQIVPAGKTPQDLGVAFFSAEAVAAIGRAFTDGKLPTTKLLTFINKDETQRLVEARIGTPLKEVLRAFGVTLQERDRLILGGPMRGSAIYSEDHPVLPDTDAIMVQDREELPLSTDYPCINCGECVRICPPLMPVNMLVRFLEAGQYEEAADSYDLYSCIECGLCSYVCPSRIPIFQYIRLAKSQLAVSTTGEE